MKTGKTKVCPIFEPTFDSICRLNNDQDRLFFYESLCRYAFYDTEPSFPEGSNLYESLWIQFRVAIDQSKKRALVSSKNGANGGRPPTALNEQKQDSPTINEPV